MAQQADTLQPVMRARDYISSRYGIHFPQIRLAELSAKLGAFSAQGGYASVDDAIDALLSGRMQDDDLAPLIESITVGETYFFREAEAIEAIASTVIPAIEARGERRLRIWVAGCATGEEAYSVAMFLHSRMLERDGWTLSILATDLNRTFLARAERGIYGSWSFRAIPPHYKSRYFRKCADGRFELDEAVRRMVTFQRLNLVSGHYPSSRNSTQDCDLIMCRNVLMYFSPATISAMVARLARALTREGWLMVSQTECCDYFSDCFDTVQSGGIFLYRKKSDAGEPSADPVRRSESGRFRRGHGRETPVRNEAAPRSATGGPARQTESKPPGATAPAEAGRPEHGDLFLRARALADGGELEQARLRCEEGLAVEPLSLKGRYLHAVILMALGCLQEARGAFRKVLFLNPDCAMATYTLGAIEWKLGNRREALSHLDRVARMLSGYEGAHLLPEAEGLTVAQLRECIDIMRRA